MKSSFDNTSLMYVGGNESNRGRPMWVIAHDYNKESMRLNGAVTCVRRRQSKTINHERILG